MLKVATAGSVDDGKSTLIGRLLIDTRSIYRDQLGAVERASRQRGDAYTDIALITDGLRAEREQGITIDVAYRYFNTPRRKFVLIDCPGHPQYTRNMVTGASKADLVVILLDARQPLTEQARRHATVASLLRVPHAVVSVNKMDLVDWSEDVFERRRREFSDFASRLSKADRDEHVRRVAAIATEKAEAGAVAIVALISPYREARDAARGATRCGTASLRCTSTAISTSCDAATQRASTARPRPLRSSSSRA